MLERLGPGLITGASGDDPSGIATYSQAGAAYGFSLLWTVVWCLPLMCAIQEISARIGRVTGRGIAGNIRRHYSPWLLHPVVILLVLANTLTVGADIGAMGAALQLLIGGSALLYAIGFAGLCLILEVFITYERYARILKWLCLVLFSYVLTVLFVKVRWSQVAAGALIPALQGSRNYWATIIAIFGTTISPYLFFWQASQETEEIRDHPAEQALVSEPQHARAQFGRIRFDTITGMLLSNVVAFCIIIAAGATLHVHGVTDVQSAGQAAEALRPLAGRFAFTIFALGIIGTGLLAVPVLAGSAAYAFGEARRWPTGLDRKPLAAKGFYTVLAAAMLIGLALNFPLVQRQLQVTPIKALFVCAIINGIAAVPIMVVVMLLAGNAKAMGRFTLTSGTLRTLGWLATAVMFLAVLGMFVTM
jgi:NRAMP (natural resistance-associated macrophage protein)-like metal ion transporter